MPIYRRKTPNVTINVDALQWCFRNDYKIYPVTEDNQNYRLMIERGAQKKMGQRIYNWRQIDQAVWDLMEYLYNKHGNKK